jgi:hypothetical protein
MEEVGGIEGSEAFSHCTIFEAEGNKSRDGIWTIFMRGHILQQWGSVLPESTR